MGEATDNNKESSKSSNLADNSKTTSNVHPVVVNNKSNKKLIFSVVLLFILVIAAGLYSYHLQYQVKPKVIYVSVKKPITKTVTSPPAITSNPNQIGDLKLDTTKDYGNKYANNILPVGDGKYSTTGAEQGNVYACSTYAQNLAAGGGGAQSRGPWFMDNNTEYNNAAKLHVEGNVMWQASFTMNEANSLRTIITNDLPTHPTGTFPIASSDPAYLYDRNPNSIEAQSLTYALNQSPTFGTPQCMGGEAGIMLTGVALFNAFDAGGRDAGAWEVQDNCEGHPQMDGLYHYHTLSSCIKNISVNNVIGYALDGFPITGPEISPNNILTTSDLDVCHGITSQITLDGKQVVTYHYVMTQDFPYSVSCFRGTPIQPPDLKKS